ncbi:MAG TPA: FAD:protein FMN transferase [Bacteroidia bacterium]|nr:FAD:protein FMN transferase [Bacteroidia bacterium]
MKRLLLLLIVALTIVSCKQKTGLQKFSFKGETMGSYYSITYFAESELVKQAEVDSFLAVFNKSLSTWDKTSLITVINSAQDKHVTDSFFRQLYRKSKEVNHFSGGIFDPTGLPLFEAWGFGLKNADNMDSAKVDSILSYVGIDKCYLAGDTLYKALQKNIRFSFDALAPGYAADLISELFVKKGITSFLVDIGGEFMVMGKKDDGTNWKVGIEKPIENKEGQNELQAFITMGEKEALATSGNYRKFYYKDGKKYSHTINVKTGYPVSHNLLSATIVAADATTADAYATTCMAMGLEDAKKFIAEHGVKAYFIYDDGGQLKEFVSDNLKQQFGK